mgnify:FL=1
MNCSVFATGLSYVSFAALAAVCIALLVLSRRLPLPKRMAYLLFPISQITLVLFSLWGVRVFELESEVILVIDALALLSSAYDVFLFHGITVAERDKESAYTAHLLAEQINAQEKHAELLASDAARAAEMRARIKAQLVDIAHSLENENESTTQELLSSACETLHAPGGHFCAHPVIDALLITKAERCQSLQIPFSAQANLPAGIPLPDVDLCAVFANLLDNATNASLKLTGSRNTQQEPFIELNSFVNAGCLAVRVRNAYCNDDEASSPMRSCGQPERQATRRLAEHGWGISIVETVAARHMGSVKATKEGGVYTMEVIMQLA